MHGNAAAYGQRHACLSCWIFFRYLLMWSIWVRRALTTLIASEGSWPCIADLRAAVKLSTYKVRAGCLATNDYINQANEWMLFCKTRKIYMQWQAKPSIINTIFVCLHLFGELFIVLWGHFLQPVHTYSIRLKMRFKPVCVGITRCPLKLKNYFIFSDVWLGFNAIIKLLIGFATELVGHWVFMHYCPRNDLVHPKYTSYYKG